MKSLPFPLLCLFALFAPSSTMAVAQIPENISKTLPTPPATIEIYRGTQRVLPPPVRMEAGTKAIGELTQQIQNVAGSSWKVTNELLSRSLARNFSKWELPQLPVVVNITVPPTVIQQVSLATVARHDSDVLLPRIGGATTASASSQVAPGYLPWAVAPASQSRAPNISEPLLSPVVPASYSTSTATPASIVATEASPTAPVVREEVRPTVIVIREPAMATSVEPNTITVSPLAIFVAACCFCFAMAATVLSLLLRTRATVPRGDGASSHLASTTTREGHLIVGGFDVGPLPEPAQKFDLGLSYSDELAQQKIAEIDSDQAMLQHILEQNLLLQAALREHGSPSRD
jgi:hypothetical protein